MRLYHGSSAFIEGPLRPHRASYHTDVDNARFGVYATDLIDIAKGMALVAGRSATADYEAEPFRVVFVDEPPDPDAMRYVYVVDAASFEPTGLAHQFVSSLPVLERLEFSTAELHGLWRMATQEERARFRETTRP